MAITATLLTAGGDNTDSPSYTTAGITPTADRLVLAWVFHRRGDTGNAAVPALSGCNLTWVEVVSITSRDRLTLFRAMGSAPSLDNVTITLAGSQTQSYCTWGIVEYAGIDTGGTNGSAAVVQSAVNSVDPGTSITATLGGFGSAANATTVGVGHRANEGTTEGTGFTEIADAAISDGAAIHVGFKATNDTTADASWTTSSTGRAIAVEIKAAGGFTSKVIMVL